MTWIQIKHDGTHQSTRAQDFQALLNMLQRSHNSHMFLTY